MSFLRHSPLIADTHAAFSDLVGDALVDAAGKLPHGVCLSFCRASTTVVAVRAICVVQLPQAVCCRGREQPDGSGSVVTIRMVVEVVQSVATFG